MTVCDAVIEYMDRTWDLALRLTFEFDVLCSHSDFLGYGFGDLSCGSLVFLVIDFAVITIFTILKHWSVF